MRIYVFATLALLLAGCSGSNFKTDYKAPISASKSQNWRVSNVQVSVPNSLTVTEENTLIPRADIVWREEPLGDRRQQVREIVSAGVKRAGAKLHGSRPVTLRVVVTQFHAISEKTRTTLSKSGVHNVEFTLQVLDSATGTALTSNDYIHAHLIAYVGAQSTNARRNGLTQKVRITDHIAKTVAGWLGVGRDNRGSFSRRGR